MEVTVIEQPKQFWQVRMDNETKQRFWKPVVGHEIKVGEFSFYAAALPGPILNVSEVTTGYKVFETQLTFIDLMVTETKELTMDFYRDYIGNVLKSIIEKTPDLKRQIEKVRESQRELLGEMPPIEDFDETLITAPLGPVN